MQLEDIHTCFAVCARVAIGAVTSGSGRVANAAVQAEGASVAARVLGGAPAAVLVHDVAAIAGAHCTCAQILTHARALNSYP